MCEGMDEKDANKRQGLFLRWLPARQGHSCAFATFTFRKIMLEKLEEIKRRYEDVELKLSDPKVIGDMKLFRKLNIEYKELSEIVRHIDEYKNVVSNIEHAKEV